MIKENLKDTGFRWLVNHRTPVRLSSTICIVHKGFRGFRALSPASSLGGNLIGLKSAIPYDTIHATLAASKTNIATN